MASNSVDRLEIVSLMTPQSHFVLMWPKSDPMPAMPREICISSVVLFISGLVCPLLLLTVALQPAGCCREICTASVTLSLFALSLFDGYLLSSFSYFLTTLGSFCN